MSFPREKAVALVVARLGSSRFPAKQFRLIGARSILDRIIDSLSKCAEVDQIVLATVAEPSNEPLKEFAQRRGIPLFWYEGDPNHVTTRLTLGAKAHAADICLLISADCPLIDPEGVDQAVASLRESPEADYLTFPPLSENAHCLLEGVQVARYSTWARAESLSDKPELKEHQFPVIYRNPGLFKAKEAHLSPGFYGAPHRMSVDTWADLEFMETMEERLKSLGLPFTLKEAVALLTREPLIGAINGHVHQRDLVEDIREILVVCDAGGEWGYGHFMRCRELSGQLVERLSWPVTFLLDDQEAAKSATECGFRVLWGALGRETRPPPEGWESPSLSEASVGKSLIIVDISARRHPKAGWRKLFDAKANVAVIDREDEFAREADLIINPGVSGRKGQRGNDAPPVIEGLDKVILRREVRRYGFSRREKDIDILAYLYPEHQRRALSEAAGKYGWNLHSQVGFTPDFPALLARANVFVSGYGQTFYEAVHLGVYPVAWPLSQLHAADATAFYNALGLSPLLVTNPGDIEKVISPLLGKTAPHLGQLTDGTPLIVNELKKLCLGDL